MSDHLQLGSLTALLAQTLEARGLDSRALLCRAGIDAATLGHADARLPSAAMDRLWQAIMAASDDDYSIAVDYARRINIGSLHVLGFGLYASANLGEASERIARAIRIVSDAPRISCTCAGDEFRVDSASLYAGAAMVKKIVFHVALLGIWRELLRVDLSPLRVHFAQIERPNDARVRARIEDYFGCPVLYRQKHTRIVLPLVLAQAPLPSANVALAARGDVIVREYLAELDRSAIAAAVVRRIAEGSFDKGSVARLLGVSPSALQRRLAAENHTFTQLLAQTRRELAAEYLRSNRYVIKEIAYLLGYTDPANFSRAFRGWYGVPPETFRGSAH